MKEKRSARMRMTRKRKISLCDCASAQESVSGLFILKAIQRIGHVKFWQIFNFYKRKGYFDNLIKDFAVDNILLYFC